MLTTIALTAASHPIHAHIDPRHAGYDTQHPRILLIGPPGWDPAPLCTWFHSTASGLRERYLLSALADPDPSASYPPPGEAYAPAPAAHGIWRWIGLHAPDLVLAVRSSERNDDLATQLPLHPVASMGAIPVIVMRELSPHSVTAALAAWHSQPSPARAEQWRRLARTPQEIAQMLSARYANALEQPVYIPAMALVGRLRLGETQAVEAIAAPFLDGSKHALANLTSSHFAGHLLFGVLAQATGKPGWLELARAAAALAFDEHGQPRDAMPLHDEMSDSLFLVCPLLAQVGALTGEPRYADMCRRHMRFIQQRTLRSDGLYRHSPLSDAAWGRGNGFAALGLLFSLEYLPPDHTAYPQVLREFQALLAALLAHQAHDGMWRQVIDVPGSYLELSATCMVAVALARGIRRGWLADADSGAPFGAALARAWHGIRLRIARDGELADVCTGTGKQTSLQAYLDRPALLGADLRGGAMALLVATELMDGGAPGML